MNTYWESRAKSVNQYNLDRVDLIASQDAGMTKNTKLKTNTKLHEKHKIRNEVYNARMTSENLTAGKSTATQSKAKQSTTEQRAGRRGEEGKANLTYDKQGAAAAAVHVPSLLTPLD